MRDPRRAALFLLMFVLVAAPWHLQGQSAARLNILFSNDDGYGAPGLNALVEAFRPVAEIVVVAPAVDQSGKAHSITTRDPIMVTERKQPDGTSWFAVDGPPATCVRLGLESLLPRRPDLVISGINRGENLGTVIYYSGTLGAAREAAIVGLPAIAVSVGGNEGKDYAAAAAFVRQVVEQLREKQMLKPGLFLNVNVPAGERKGVQTARLSMKAGGDVHFERRISPAGRPYFWQVFHQIDDDVEGTDVWAFFHGYIAVTPMALDVTAPQAMEGIRLLNLHLPD